MSSAPLVILAGPSEPIRRFKGAVRRGDLAVAWEVYPHIPKRVRMDELKWCAVNAPLPVVEALAARVLPDLRGPAAQAAYQPFEAAMEVQRWEALERLLPHVPTAGLGIAPLSMACRHHAPPLLLDRLVEVCDLDTHLFTRWERVFTWAVAADHQAWLNHAWPLRRVGEEKRLSVMLASVTDGRPHMVDVLLNLGPFRTVSRLIKACVPPTDPVSWSRLEAVDFVASRLPAAVAREFLSRTPTSVQAHLKLTQERVLASQRHEQALAEAPPSPVRSSPRRRA